MGLNFKRKVYSHNCTIICVVWKLKTVKTIGEFTNMFQNNNGNLIVVYKFITMISNYIQNLPITSLLFTISIITYCTIIVQDVRLFLVSTNLNG